MLREIRIFVIIWFGQSVSMLGTAMTRFALLIWAYEQTGQATTLALLGFFSYIMYILLGLVAGVWVDRWNRRWVMIGSDLGAGMITLTLLALYATGHLHIWHLYAAEALTGAFEAFQHPAYNASMSVLVPREHLARANALRSTGADASRILAPAFAGLLLHWANLTSVMLVDVVTFCFAVGTLLIIRIPRPSRSHDGDQAASESSWRQFTFSFRYIARRPGLAGMMVIYMLINFFAALTYFGVLPAMILARSGGNEAALSSVQSALGIGGVIGGVILTVWGGPKKLIHGMLGIGGLSFLISDSMFAIGQSTGVWIAAALAAAVSVPFIVSSNRAIWQSKVPPDIQGRVLGAALTLQSATTPFGFLLAGPLADRIMEPAMQPGGALSGLFGGLVGTGPGAGMGLMFLISATMGALSCFSGYLIPALRRVERELPDHTALPGDLLEGAGAAD